MPFSTKFTSHHHHHRRDHLQTYQHLLPLLLLLPSFLQQEQLQQKQQRQQEQQQHQHLCIIDLKIVCTRSSKAIKNVLTFAVSSEDSSPVSSNLVTRFLNKLIKIILLYNKQYTLILTEISTEASAQIRAARETMTSSFSIADISSKGAMLFSTRENQTPQSKSE